MPSIETKLYQAIKARVNTLPMKAAYPVIWTTGEAYVEDVAKPYIRATWLPNMNRRLFHKGTDPHERLSILQLDVMGKRTDGDGVAREIAGQVAAHFPADLPLTFQGVTVRVTKAPDAGPLFVDKFIQAPVMINLRAFA